MLFPAAPVVIFGAGSIGCYIGAHWAAGGMPVILLGRTALKQLENTGLSTTNGVSLSPQDCINRLKITDDPAVLAQAGQVIVTVKSTALLPVMAAIKQHVRPEIPVLCLLNGLAPTRELRAGLSDHKIETGMVPFNVVWHDNRTLKRTSVGKIILQDTPANQALAQATFNSREPATTTQNIGAVQYGKLLLNLNNPINALSGLSLYNQLSQRDYRNAYAAILAETISILDTAKIPHAKSGPLPAHRIVQMLRTPDWLFNSIALRLQKLDPSSQTSMAQDLAAGKPTEIDTLNGEILAIAEKTGQEAPINTTIVRLIKAAESGGQKQFSGSELLAMLR